MSTPASFAAERPLVRLHRAIKQYRRRTVLRLDAFELCRGDSLLIHGENGSGKSTLLRVIAGVSALSSGEVHHTPAFDALEIAFVPQAGGLHPGLSVAENLRLAVRLRGRSEPDRLAQHWYVGGLGLDAHLETRFRDLSGGFQRLAALSCALAAAPGALFIDEPFSGVDDRHARLLADGLATARSQLDLLVLTGHCAGDFAAANRRLELRAGAPV